MENKRNAIILCSGGLDSVVTANYVKKRKNYEELTIIFFNYGQKSLKEEKKCSINCAQSLNAKFTEIKIDWLSKISESLITIKGKINKITRRDLKDTKEESEKFYVPCRNLIFLSYALALAEAEYVKTKKTSDIYVGFKCEGKESYPDTTRSFVNKINALSNVSCSKKFKVIAPLIKKDKEDIIKLAEKLKAPLVETFSCYTPKKNKHCGDCLACALRKEGFYWANVEDPTRYS